MFMLVFQCCVLSFLIFNTSGTQQNNKTYLKYKKPIVRQDNEIQSSLINNDEGFGGNEDDRGKNEDIGPGNEENGQGNGYDEGSIQEGDLLNQEETEEAPDQQLSSERELLDRNKPEPGFDLSHEEMMKFKLWPNAFIPYYIDVPSFSGKFFIFRNSFHLSGLI